MSIFEREKEGENIYFECVSVHNFYGVQSDGVPLWSALKKYCIPFVVFIWRHLVFCVHYISMSFICMLSVWFISFFVWHNVCCCGVNNIAAWMVVYPPRLNIQAADKIFWLRGVPTIELVCPRDYILEFFKPLFFVTVFCITNILWLFYSCSRGFFHLRSRLQFSVWWWYWCAWWWMEPFDYLLTFLFLCCVCLSYQSPNFI